MRKTKFNKFERVAGIFVLSAVAGVVLTAATVAIKQGWFETKVYYSSVFENADGLHQGTIVQMAGLRAGAVDEVELQANNKIRVSFYVLGKFQERIHQDSTIQIIRPFIIGERVIDVSVGAETTPVLAANSSIPATETTDFMTLMSGRTLNTYLNKISGILENVQILVDAFADKKRAESMIRMFDRLDPLMKNMNTMTLEMTKLSQQATHDEGVQKLVSNLAITTTEMNRILPELNKENPRLAKDLASMTQDLAMMTKALGPAMKAVEGQLPGASLRLIEALNETVVVLKAMQKSFLMKSNVREVQEEESSRRVPANTPK
ncbi:MAG TPA: MlaD family protein [Bdellovibrio sp.]|nr:MlaD family protein [Bdellovibrio sp.]